MPRTLLVFAAALAAAGVAPAQPAKPPEPAFELRVRSLDDLVRKGEYLVGLTGEEDWIKQFKAFVTEVTGTTPGKGVEGIDPKKPFGAFAVVSLDVVNSPVTIMVPVADRDQFVTFLADKLGLKFAKGEDDTLTTKADIGPLKDTPVFLRFAHGYAYFARSAKALDPKGLITPEAFFANDDGAVASLVFRADRVPALVRVGVLGRLKGWIGDVQKDAAPETEFGKTLSAWLGDTTLDAATTLAEGAKEVRVRLTVDEKEDRSSAELVVVPKPGTTLAANFASLGNKTSTAAAIVSARETVARASICVAMPDQAKKGFNKVIDVLLSDTPAADRPKQDAAVGFLRVAVAVFEPVIRAGELDVAVALSAPDADGRRAVLGAAKVARARELERMFKVLALGASSFLTDKDGKPSLPVEFKFDVERVGDYSLHRVTFQEVPPEVEKFFGGKGVALWLAVSEDHVAFSVEADAAALKAGLRARPVPAPPASLEVRMARVAPLFADSLTPEAVKKASQKVFGDGPVAGKDVIALTATGGTELTLKLRVEGKAVRMIRELSRLALEASPPGKK